MKDMDMGQEAWFEEEEDREAVRRQLNRRLIFLENALSQQRADGGHIEALHWEIDQINRQLKALEEKA